MPIPLPPSPIPLNAPQGAPMAAPNPKEGLRAAAQTDIQNAVQLIEKNLKPDVFPVDGPEWKQLYGALKSLKKIAGDQQSKELSAAGLKNIASALSPKGMGGIMGGPGGAPGGAPGGPPGGGAPGGMPMAGPSPLSLLGMG